MDAKSLEELGFRNLTPLDRLLTRDHGLIIVVSGTTGAGKTTTMVSLGARWHNTRWPELPIGDLPRSVHEIHRNHARLGGHPFLLGTSNVMLTEMRDVPSIRSALDIAAEKPVVAIMHSATVEETLKRLGKFGADLDNLAPALIAVMSIRLTRRAGRDFNPPTMTPPQARSQARYTVISEYVTFETPEAVKGFQGILDYSFEDDINAKRADGTIASEPTGHHLETGAPSHS